LFIRFCHKGSLWREMMERFKLAIAEFAGAIMRALAVATSSYSLAA
jgi:hypothetical protein